MFSRIVAISLDAIVLCHHPMTVRWQELEHLVHDSREGDWIYPREKYCCYKDLFLECPDAGPHSIDCYILVVVWLLKHKLLAMHHSGTQAVTWLLDTTLGNVVKQNQDIRMAISGFVLGLDVGEWDSYSQRIEDQYTQINQLAQTIEDLNPRLLSSMKHCVAAMASLPPSDPTFDSVTDSEILQDCHQLVDSIPGVKDWLILRFPQPADE